MHRAAALADGELIGRADRRGDVGLRVGDRLGKAQALGESRRPLRPGLRVGRELVDGFGGGFDPDADVSRLHPPIVAHTLA